eukprot:CAMPEP_0196817598 /NCGR_PEP_ID=MMETSP1362-20130617/61652_1 /TAXON_ID=163516 /ORGANISM="Leptocylindrus danicus, Strain CCMP1856" /LENGTH=494 /DNA_ID=CAMNT_0042195373 /DNA_START=92 /DNA_END=1573 /DNA_ORIENTATION=+
MNSLLGSAILEDENCGSMGDQKMGTTMSAAQQQLNPFAATDANSTGIPRSWLSLDDHELHVLTNATHNINININPALDNEKDHHHHDDTHGLTLDPRCVLPMEVEKIVSHAHSSDTISSVSDVSAKLYESSTGAAGGLYDPLLEKKQRARVDINRFMNNTAPRCSSDGMVIMDEYAMVTNQYKVLEDILTGKKKKQQLQKENVVATPVSPPASAVQTNSHRPHHPRSSAAAGVPAAQARLAPLVSTTQAQAQAPSAWAADPCPFPQGMTDPNFIREQQEAYARFQGQGQVVPVVQQTQQEPVNRNVGAVSTSPFLHDIHDAQFIREQQEAYARFQPNHRSNNGMETNACTVNVNAGAAMEQQSAVFGDAKKESSAPQGYSYQDYSSRVQEKPFIPQDMKDANFIRQQEEALARFQSQGTASGVVKNEKPSRMYRNSTEHPARALNQFGSYAAESTNDIFNMENPAQSQAQAYPNPVDEVDRFMPLQIEDKLVTW